MEEEEIRDLFLSLFFLIQLINMSITATKIEVSLSVHTTEDIEKNMTAVINLLEEDLVKEANITIEELEGGYGNPIEYISMIFNKNKDIEKILKLLASKLSQQQKKQLYDEFDERFDSEEKTYFLRINKEEIYNKRLVIASSDNIR